MRIFLLRHGEAAELGGAVTHDGERPLTREGMQKLAAAAKVYARVTGRPDRILASPLRRARESAEVLARATDYHQPIETNDVLVPAADPDLALALLHGEAESGLASIALVGHEPHLGALFGLLATGATRVAIPLKKGMLVAVEWEGPATLVGRVVAVLSQRVARDLG
jgi:phosphohistidine phosphatase